MSVSPPPRGRLPQTAMQEQLSIAWLHMTASAAGCKLQRWDTDYDSVDVTVHASAKYSAQSAARVDFQLKCTTREEYLSDTHLAYPLKRRNYEELADKERDVPAVFGVLMVPDDPLLWLTQDEEKLLVASRMYWDFARDWPAFDEGQETKTVYLPRTNILDVDGLLSLLQEVAEMRAS